MSEAVFSTWTIYFNPKDHPGKYVVRRFEIGKALTRPTNDMFVADTLDEARALLPIGLLCFKRDLSDDPVIVETWL